MSTSYISRGKKKEQLLPFFYNQVLDFSSVTISTTKSDFKEINSAINIYTGQILDKRNPEGLAKGM